MVAGGRVAGVARPDQVRDLRVHRRRLTVALQTGTDDDDGTKVPVVEMSDGWLQLAKDAPGATEVGKHWSAVLILPSGEIPISGTVESANEAGVVIKLDLLIREYAATLEDYLTRLHMLDFVV